jgi:hypothetical protein
VWTNQADAKVKSIQISPVGDKTEIPAKVLTKLSGYTEDNPSTSLVNEKETCYKGKDIGAISKIKDTVKFDNTKGVLSMTGALIISDVIGSYFLVAEVGPDDEKYILPGAMSAEKKWYVVIPFKVTDPKCTKIIHICMPN